MAPDAPPASKLGYIRIATFSRATTEATRAALEALRAAGAERFVLDVRNNGGGLFPSGVEVARMWIDKGDVVLIADSQGVRDVYEAEGSALERRAPLAVLVNKGTASASEVRVWRVLCAACAASRAPRGLAGAPGGGQIGS